MRLGGYTDKEGDVSWIEIRPEILKIIVITEHLRDQGSNSTHI